MRVDTGGAASWRPPPRPLGRGVDTDPTSPDAAEPGEAAPADPRHRARRAGLTALGGTLVVLGAPVGVATPFLPVGFLVSGAGAALIVRNSPAGRRLILRAFERYPRVSSRVPMRMRRLIFGVRPDSPPDTLKR